jgi:stringent starvation protein B
MPQPLPPKKEVALALLERSRVHVHLDPRKDGVTVPVGFRKQAQLVLEIGLNMPVPIPDLRVDDDSMTCTLSFSRTPFYCLVPWPAVFAMVGDDGRGMVWPEDVPPEIQAQATQAAQASRPAEPEAPRPRIVSSKRAHMEAVPNAKSTGSGKNEKSDRSDRAEKADKPEEKKARKPSRSKRPRVVAVESEPERPVLVALPQPQPQPQDQQRRGPRAVPSAKKRTPAPAAPARKPAPGKAKRELPPYLRVVK